MSPREALAKLKGSESDKRSLFDYFIERAQTAVLEDWEAVMLEALKKDFMAEKTVVQMSATMRGVGRARI